jgi:hypothetical protein
LASRKYRILAVELSDIIERRDSSKPNLYVGLSKVVPETRFEELLSGEGPENLRDHFKQLRMDLIEDVVEYSYMKQAKKALQREKRRLARQGHWLNGQHTVWHGYVIDLDTEGITNFGKGFVYVGQTSLTPEERFEIHKAPKPAPPARDLASKIVRRRGLRLNYELMGAMYPKSPVYTAADAKSLERSWAMKLKRMGYRVEAGDATPSETDH